MCFPVPEANAEVVALTISGVTACVGLEVRQSSKPSGRADSGGSYMLCPGSTAMLRCEWYWNRLLCVDLDSAQATRKAK